MSPIIPLIIFAAVVVLGAILLRLQRELEGCVGKSSRAKGKPGADRPREFYDAFADRRPNAVPSDGSRPTTA